MNLPARTTFSKHFQLGKGWFSWHAKGSVVTGDLSNAEQVELLEPFPFRLNRNGGFISLFDAFS